MFRPALNSVKRSVVRTARQARFNSSSASASGGDTRWMLASVAVTVPALGYLLAPPAQKASVHKTAHAAAAEVGLKEAEPEEAADATPAEHHGPDSRTSHKEQSQSPEEHREQAARTTSKSAKSGDDKEGREDGATSPTGGDIGSKQSGLSNTETMHQVPGVIKEGESQTAKSSVTIAPHNTRGSEKDGPGNSSKTTPSEPQPDADKDTDEGPAAVEKDEQSAKEKLDSQSTPKEEEAEES